MHLSARTRSLRYFRALVGLLSMAFLNACFSVQAPQVKDRSRILATFTHTGMETSCVQCHEQNRPAAVLINGKMQLHGDGKDCVACHKPGGNWAEATFSHTPTPKSCMACHDTDRPIGLVGPAGSQFDHAKGGMGDCVSCHASGAGQTWAKGYYVHDSSTTTCIGCHLSKRPTGLVGPVGNQFDHSKNGTGDCISCHNQSAGVSWENGFYNHSPAPGTCIDCHIGRRPVGLVGPIGNQFDHSKGGTGDCILCHKATPGTSWAPGAYNHTPAPTTCIACHIGKRPQGVTNNFDHAIAGTGDCITCHKAPGVRWSGAIFGHTPAPASCIGCHLSSRPKGLVGPPTNQFDHSNAGTGDCVMCHKSAPGTTWAPGTYNHTPAPTTCLGCHLGDRPTGLVGTGGNQFDHSKGGTGDCVMCHKSAPGTTWAPGSFSHSPAPTTCLSCHLGARPKGLVGPAGNQFDHALNGTGDCISCHRQPGVTWADGKFSHSPVPTTCSGCHIADRPTTLVGLPGHQFDHSSFGTADCVSCHKQNVGVNWTGGSFNHTPAPATCIICHVGRRPQGLVGPVGSQFDHSNGGTGDCASCHKSPGVNWSGGTFGHTPAPTACITCHNGRVSSTTAVGPVGDRFVHNSSYGGNGECITCHKTTPGTVWTGGKYGHTPAPTACIACHAGRVSSTALVGPPGDQFIHSSTYGGNGECVTCHKAAPGTAWTGGKYSHSPAPTTCMNCHAAKRPTTPINGFDHTTSGTGDCVSCHKQPGITWTGGIFNHTPTPASCTSCHSTDRPSATALVPAGATKNLFVHAIQFKGLTDCKGCHTSVAANIGVSWAGGIYDHKTSTNATVATCTPCHDQERPKTAINGFNHSTSGTGDCAGCHKQPGVAWVGGLFNHTPTPTACASCHSSDRPAAATLVGPVGDKFLHSSTYGGNGDCVSCHTKVTANIGVTWAGGDFSHTPAPTACVTCHTGRVSATAPVGPSGDQFIHSATYGGNGECFTCHKATPGTVWTGGNYNHSPAPTTCTPCHAAKRPTTIINGFNHSTSGTGDCAACHKSPGITWTGATAAHASSGSTAGSTLDCVGCHGLNGSATTRLKVTETQHYGVATTAGGITKIVATNCIGCHTDFSSFPNKLKFAHTSNTYYCMDCHNFNSGSYTSFTKVAAFNVGTNFTLSATTVVTASRQADTNGKTNKGPHSDTAHFKQCSSCHSYTAPVAGANVWKWVHEPKNPGVKNSKSTPGCNLCH